MKNGFLKSQTNSCKSDNFLFQTRVITEKLVNFFSDRCWEAKFLLYEIDTKAREGQTTCLVVPLHSGRAGTQTLHHHAEAVK